MNDNEKGVMAALIIGGAILYLYGRNQSKEQPRFQTDWNDQQVINTQWDWHRLTGGNGDRFVEPEHHIGSTVTLPVRFPARSGHELSCIIHHGWSQLAKSRPQDSDWMYAPPSEDDL